MCSTCYRDTEEGAASTTYKNKELAIGKSIREHVLLKDIDDVYMIWDKAVGMGCRRRPDILIKLEMHNIMVEVDEHQHNHTSYNEEDARIIEIHYALESVPLIVIRFNPDAYKDENGEYHGLFKGEGDEVELRRQQAYASAMDMLATKIHSAIYSIPAKAVTTHYLRYTPEACKGKYKKQYTPKVKDGADQ